MRPRRGIHTSWLLAGVALAGCRGDVGKFEVAVLSRDSMFTTAEGENVIEVEARSGPTGDDATVRWTVERGVGGEWSKIAVADGRKITVPVQPLKKSNRLKGAHPSSSETLQAQLDRLRLRYRISAQASGRDGKARSEPIEVVQSLLTAIRQEYLDIGLRHGAPPAEWFRETSSLPRGPSYGDYPIAAANPEFMTRLGRLERTWRDDYQLPWQLNSHYRNPIHNRFHVGGSGSGPVSNSWHQFGCAADLQTFPVLTRGKSTRADTVKARDFWSALAEEGLELGFEVEPRDKDPTRPGRAYSGVGHVHFELDCPP